MITKTQIYAAAYITYLIISRIKYVDASEAGR